MTIDPARLADLSEMADVSEDVALQLASELILSGAYDRDARIAEMDDLADAVIGRRAFQDDDADHEVDLAVLAEDAGF